VGITIREKEGEVLRKRWPWALAAFFCAALLTAYILVVAYIKVDFVSPLPIIIACGLAPLMAAIGVLLCFGGGLFRRFVCCGFAVIFIGMSPIGLLASAAYNKRSTVLYAQSPQGNNKMVVVQTHGRAYDEVYAICPMRGLWYRQQYSCVAYNQKPIPEDFRWIDEDTVEIKVRRYYYDLVLTSVYDFKTGKVD